MRSFSPTSLTYFIKCTALTSSAITVCAKFYTSHHRTRTPITDLVFGAYRSILYLHVRLLSVMLIRITKIIVNNLQMYNCDLFHLQCNQSHLHRRHVRLLVHLLSTSAKNNRKRTKDSWNGRQTIVKLCHVNHFDLLAWLIHNVAL